MFFIDFAAKVGRFRQSTKFSENYFYDAVKNASNISVAEFVVHGQAYDTVGHFICLWQILTGCTGKTTIGGEVGDEGIEEPAAERSKFQGCVAGGSNRSLANSLIRWASSDEGAR